MPERMSEYMPERMSDRMSEYIYIFIFIYLYIPNIYLLYRWYVTNYVRIVSKAGDHSKKVISMFFLLVTSKQSTTSFAVFINYAL
jgi:hypothetical protein